MKHGETALARTRPETARFRLRSATAACHERLDRLFSSVDIGHREGYGRFLMAQAAAQVPIEQALTLADAATVLSDWPQRRRARSLIGDLAELRLHVPCGVAIPDFDEPAAVLGAIYVLEGSRLGARVLSRRVPAHLPTRFLGSEDASGWRDFIGKLDARLIGENDLAIAKRAAIGVFAAFEDSALRFLSDDQRQTPQHSAQPR